VRAVLPDEHIRKAEGEAHYGVIVRADIAIEILNQARANLWRAPMTSKSRMRRGETLRDKCDRK
jgi:hypothetical protein